MTFVTPETKLFTVLCSGNLTETRDEMVTDVMAYELVVWQEVSQPDDC